MASFQCDECGEKITTIHPGAVGVKHNTESKGHRLILSKDWFAFMLHQVKA